MPRAEFFEKFGLFVIRDFLDGQTCAALRAEMHSGKSSESYIIRDGIEMVDRGSRSTKEVKISKSTRAFVKKCLLSVKPRIEKHFDLPLNDCEAPSFLLYQEDDFFRPHQDKQDSNSTLNRQVSVVIFLNGEDETCEAQAYSGGRLTLFGLVNDERWKNYGFPLIGEAGMMIAFRSDTVHEVKRVSRGQRQTIVSWYIN
jgi:SM-20-related protein